MFLLNTFGIFIAILNALNSKFQFQGVVAGTSTKMWERIPTMAGDNGFNLLLGHSVELSCGKSQRSFHWNQWSIQWLYGLRIKHAFSFSSSLFLSSFWIKPRFGRTKDFVMVKRCSTLQREQRQLFLAQTYQVLQGFGQHIRHSDNCCSHWEFH